MDNQKLVHWRVGGKVEHCGCEILPHGKDIENIIIEKIVHYDTKKVAGEVLNDVWEAYFVANNGYTNLPMMLNKVNRRRLVKQAGTDYPQIIRFFPVRLTKEETRDVRNGGMTDGLRISLTRATRYPLVPNSEAYNKVKENLAKAKDKETAMLYYKALYNIDEPLEKQLLTK